MAELASEYLILWASQTGSAEWIAKNVHTEALSKGYKGQCFVMDDYESVSVVFLILQLMNINEIHIGIASKCSPHYSHFL